MMVSIEQAELDLLVASARWGHRGLMALMELVQLRDLKREIEAHAATNPSSTTLNEQRILHEMGRDYTSRKSKAWDTARWTLYMVPPGLACNLADSETARGLMRRLNPGEVEYDSWATDTRWMHLSPIRSGAGSDLMLLSDFKAQVTSQFFSDYDGMGSWATATHYLDGSVNWVYPSRVRSGAQRPPAWATHVLWYNR